MAKYNVDMTIKARDEATKTLKGIEGAMGRFSSVAKSVLGGLGVYFSGKALLGFAKDSLSAFAMQERATVLLGQALANTGQYTEGMLKGLQDVAGEIQKTTTVADEDAEELMQLGLSMGLSADKIEEATKGAIGLNAALGIGMESAMQLTSKALQGQYNKLAGYIPALKEAKTEGEKQAIVQKTMENSFKLATAEITTQWGQLEQIKNIWGNMKEAIGAVLSPVYVQIASDIKFYMMGTTDELQNQTILANTLLIFYKQIGLEIKNWKSQYSDINGLLTGNAKGTWAKTKEVLGVGSGVALGMVGDLFTLGHYNLTGEALARREIEVRNEARKKGIPVPWAGKAESNIPELLGRGKSDFELMLQKLAIPRKMGGAPGISAYDLDEEGGAGGGGGGGGGRLSFMESRFMTTAPGSKIDNIAANTKRTADGTNDIVAAISNLGNIIIGKNQPVAALVWEVA